MSVRDGQSHILGNTEISAGQHLTEIAAEVDVCTGTTYTTLQATCDAASSGDTLLCRSAPPIVENFTANRDITIALNGGYTVGYGSNPFRPRLKGRRKSTAATSLFYISS